MLFCCLGGGRVVSFAVWEGDGSSLTFRSALLGVKGSNNEKDQTEKQTRVSFPGPKQG